MADRDGDGFHDFPGAKDRNSLRIRLIRLDRVMLDEQVLGPAMEEHLALLAALRTRDPQHAVAAIDAHLTHARSRALGL